MFSQQKVKVIKDSTKKSQILKQIVFILVNVQSLPVGI